MVQSSWVPLKILPLFPALIGIESVGLGPEGFRIASVKSGGRAVIVIASDGDVGALYGVFHFLRLMQTLQQ